MRHDWEMFANGNYISTFIYVMPTLRQANSDLLASSTSCNVLATRSGHFDCHRRWHQVFGFWVVFASAKPFRLGDAQGISVAAMLCLSSGLPHAHFASADALLNLFLALAFVDMYRHWNSCPAQTAPGIRLDWVRLPDQGTRGGIGPHGQRAIVFASTAASSNLFAACKSLGQFYC